MTACIPVFNFNLESSRVLLKIKTSIHAKVPISIVLWLSVCFEGFAHYYVSVVVSTLLAHDNISIVVKNDFSTLLCAVGLVLPWLLGCTGESVIWPIVVLHIVMIELSDVSWQFPLVVDVPWVQITNHFLNNGIARCLQTDTSVKDLEASNEKSYLENTRNTSAQNFFQLRVTQLAYGLTSKCLISPSKRPPQLVWPCPYTDVWKNGNGLILRHVSRYVHKSPLL